MPGSKTTNASLAAAIGGRNFEKALVALRKGADPNTRSKDGDTLLMVWAARGVRDGEDPEPLLAQLRTLLDAGIDPNATSERGTALDRALLSLQVGRGCPQVVTLLLERGADPNVATGKDRQTSLHRAATYQGPTVVRWLLDAGARVDVTSADGSTPLDYATRADTRKLLERAKAGKLRPGRKEPAPAKRPPPPAALLLFLARQGPKLSGRKVTGLPNYTRDSELTVRFHDAPDPDFFRQLGVDPLSCPSYHPLASLEDEVQVLVVDGAKKALPVLMWEHEDSQFYPVAKSLEAFAKRLEAAAGPARSPRAGRGSGRGRRP
jgi:hypothetical protein